MKRLKNWLTNYLFNAVDPKDIFYDDGAGGLYLDGNKLSDDDILALGRQVRDFKETDLHKTLFGTVENRAKKTMFERSTNYNDMLSGKMLLLALDLQNKVMESISKEYDKRVGK